MSIIPPLHNMNMAVMQTPEDKQHLMYNIFSVTKELFLLLIGIVEHYDSC
jgi:hypothetical protein